MRQRRKGVVVWVPAILPVLVVSSLVGCLRSEPLIRVSGPTDILSFEVRQGSGEILWRIEAGEPTAVDVIHYGGVPLGFRQTFPTAGQTPRPFEFYEALELETTTTQRGFLHWGFAAGPGQMDIRSSRTWLLEPPDELDAGEQEEASEFQEAVGEDS